MFVVQKNNLDPVPWQPSATWDTLKKRAALLAKCRAFFAKRNIIEVETPILSHATVTDPFIESMPVAVQNEKACYLQTSPEYAMKRLLAAGAGPIYQITKSFRQGEKGKWHNPEFTMLEWYRLGMDHHDLMQEVVEFLEEAFDFSEVDKKSVQAIYEEQVGFNPHSVTIDELKSCAKIHGLAVSGSFHEGPRLWLDLIFSHCIEPQLGRTRPLLIYDFPVSQAALAQVHANKAARFELYFQGVELANGFFELQDPSEQRLRFQNDLAARAREGLPLIAMDERFLAALEKGLPSCAGVAVGIDRLIMLALGHSEIATVLSFDFARA